MKNKFTVLLAALLAVAPQLITAVPAEYRDVATAIIGVLGAVYHLYQPAPPSNGTK